MRSPNANLFSTRINRSFLKGVLFEEVNESYTTRTCNFCRGDTGPRGINGLGIREWECRDCGTVHDRDVNSALNILALGHERLAVGIPVL